ncbi:MAG: hypothetical protein IPO86_00150 [Saprospiraceae bacterium]|nr:hypothetical protein [Saprospiraceae bacterium]
MTYLEWNEHIAKLFFKPDNAGKDILFYLTREDLIKYSRANFNGTTDENIWADFIHAIKFDQQEKNDFAYPYSPIAKPLELFSKWNKTSTPPFIAYLILYVIPLTETYEENFISSAYYGKVNAFFNKYEILNHFTEKIIWWGNFQTISPLFSQLEEWTVITNNCDLGIFELKKFGNENWVHVGKPLSQCVFPPRAIKRLPELFLHAGMIPDSTYQPAEFKKYLLQYGSSILLLPNSVIDIIRKYETHDLGQSIIDTTKKAYKNWTGESHSVDETGATARTKRNDISSRIFLQLQLFSNEGRIEFSYRMKSANEFAEDLSFNGIEIREEKLGYSKTLKLPFKETFQLKDDFNKWVAKFPDKDVRLFISAGSLQFSTDYWIETDTLTKANWMYLLCKNSLREKILSWGKNQCTKFEDETDLENMPDGISLFRFLNPREGIDEIPVLTIIKEKFVQLTSALEFDFRTFTNDFLPEVEILNSDGTEKIYLQYKNNEEKFFLKKKISNSNRWLLPEELSLFSDFNIRTDEEKFAGNETTYKVVSANGSALLLDGTKLPKRNSFGRTTDQVLTQYSFGSNTVGINLMKQIPYQQLFRGINADSNTGNTQPTYTHSEGNIFLSFLTLKGTTTAKDFYSAFEFLHSKYFGNKPHSNNFNYSKVKKASLNFFDYLGYLDYEYETKSIVVNPPQLIFIPASKGRKVLLIGGRDETLVNAIIATAPKHNLQVEITKQFQSNEDLLLPDAITIKSFGTAKEVFGEKNLIAFASELKIKFSSGDLVQVGLQHFCSDIDEYEKDLFATKETTLTYEDWARYIFNPDTLQLDKSFSENFDKSFTMLEYRLRPWEFHHRLWANQKCYDIDKNWGKYVALKHQKKHVILYDRNKEKVAVPLELPLPRLLAESIMLLSGLAPVYSEIESKAYRVYENIPSVFIQNLFDKLKQKTIDFNF